MLWGISALLTAISVVPDDYTPLMVAIYRSLTMATPESEAAIPELLRRRWVRGVVKIRHALNALLNIIAV